MVVPWIWYSIWKFWVIYVLVSLVFHVFSTAELISPCKTVNLAVWAFSSIFLHDFTLYGIDMNYIYHISSITTIFGPLSKVTILGHKCMAILGIRRTEYRCTCTEYRWSCAWKRNWCRAPTVGVALVGLIIIATVGCRLKKKRSRKNISKTDENEDYGTYSRGWDGEGDYGDGDKVYVTDTNVYYA